MPSNTFSLYDHVLDAIALAGAAPLEMTKWFDTNHH